MGTSHPLAAAPPRQQGAPRDGPHRTIVNQRTQIVEVVAGNDRLGVQVASVNGAIERVPAELATNERVLAHHVLGRPWGASKLALPHGVSSNTALKVMKKVAVSFASTDRKRPPLGNAAEREHS